MLIKFLGSRGGRRGTGRKGRERKEGKGKGSNMEFVVICLGKVYRI